MAWGTGMPMRSLGGRSQATSPVLELPARAHLPRAAYSRQRGCRVSPQGCIAERGEQVTFVRLAGGLPLSARDLRVQAAAPALLAQNPGRRPERSSSYGWVIGTSDRFRAVRPLALLLRHLGEHRGIALTMAIGVSATVWLRLAQGGKIQPAYQTPALAFRRRCIDCGPNARRGSGH